MVVDPAGGEQYGRPLLGGPARCGDQQQADYKDQDSVRHRMLLPEWRWNRILGGRATSHTGTG